MKHTLYEAAVRCDFAHWMPRDGVTFPEYELVVDLDGCSLGLCRCEETGLVTLLDQVSTAQSQPLDQIWIEGIRRIRPMPEEWLRQLTESGEGQNRLWKYYLASRRLDDGAFFTPDGPLQCAFLDETFQPVREALTDLLEQGLNRAEKLEIPEEKLRVLTVGRLAVSAPAKLVLREALTSDPFLPDHRFVEPDEEVGDIVALGTTLLEESETVGFDLSLLCMDENRRETSPLRLAEERQPLSSLEQLSYSQPLFVCDGDRLHFQAGKNQWEESLPYTVGPTGGDLVEVACGLRDGRPVILLRRTLAPTRVYEIMPKP